MTHIVNYDTYCEYRTHLVKASHHIEMANFYSSLSLKLPNLSDDKGTRAFLKAIDCLTLCDMLACLIDDVIEWELAHHLQNRITEHRNYFINEFKNSKGKLSKKMSKIGQEFYENIDEILSECQDHYLRLEISEHLRKMVYYLKKAERAWGITS